MGDLSNFFSGGQQGAYNSLAQGLGNLPSTLNQYNQQGQAYLNPYYQYGTQSLPQYNNFLNTMQQQMNGNWMQNYQQSPYAKYLTNTGLNSMNNAAAATGTLGSGANQQQNAQLASQIAGQDMQNYFNNMQSQNQMYMGGLGNLMNMGYGSGMGMAGMNMGYGEDIASILAQQAQANANSQSAGGQGKDSAIGGLIGGLL